LLLRWNSGWVFNRLHRHRDLRGTGQGAIVAALPLQQQVSSASSFFARQCVTFQLLPVLQYAHRYAWLL